jgi:hypothetical protein
MHRLLATSLTFLALTSVCASLSGATTDQTAQARASSHAISVRGRPFFPVMLIDQCSADAASQARALGINLILNEHCPDVPQGTQLAQIESTSLAVLSIQSRDVRGHGLVGWTFPDEPENNGWTPASLQQAHPYQRGSRDGLLSFLTTGAGFFHAPYRTGNSRFVYGRFARLADVAGFDLYPLGHCQSDLKAVYDAQREFVGLAGPMPTFQWIETGPIRPSYCGGFEMTPAQLRAETWLAIAGGARGIGYFTHTWSPEHRAFDVSPALQRTIAKISGTLTTVRPGLLGDTIDSRANSDAIKLVARTGGDTVYVFAVNGNPAGLSAKLHIPDLQDGPVRVLGQNRTVMVRNHRFDDRFGALAVHIYVQRTG